MSEATVTAQIATYLRENASTAVGGNNTIPFLNVVNQYPPKFEPEGTIMANDLPADSPITAGINSGAIIYLYMKSDDESQIEFRGTTDPGGKMVYYDYDLICVMFSEHAKSENTGLDNTQFVDGLRQAIRNSKNAGGTGAVFSWGQGNQSGSKDISVRKDLPQQFNGTFGKTYVYTVVSLQVLEDLTGNGGSSLSANTVTRAYPFTYSTATHTGLVTYTPQVGEVLVGFQVSCTTAFNGTTPKGDLFFNDADEGWFALNGGSLDMTTTDNLATGIGVPISALSYPDAYCPYYFTSTNPVTFVVSQDGTYNGTSSGSTQGAGTVYLITAVST